MPATEKKSFFHPRTMAVTAILGAVSTVLMFFSFSVPVIPFFVKLDFSELPALIAAFSLGPLSGVAVCLVKNLVNVLFTYSGGVGELCNFLLGASFVLPAGLLYRYRKSRKGALVGSLAGALAMALFSLPLNYFLVYPAYSLVMPMEEVLGLYQAINPNVHTLFDALLWFNAPFTFVKGLLDVALAFLLYKRLSPILKGAPRA